MPKLLGDTVAENRRKIEVAALKLFTRQGFHGTTVREIARKGGVSMGKLYLYYPNKEDIFVALVQRMEQRMVQLRQTEILPHMQSPDPDSLRKLGMAVGKVVSENLDYWRLMYVDVVEFRHKHFVNSYREIAGGLRTFSTALFQKAPIPFPSDVNPGFAYVTLYLQFVTYFLVEELFGAKRHLGVSDAEAVDQFVRLYTRGRKDRPSRP
ncbi:MAG: TetR/AcrR family transcriptional regulator [Candidatus Sulfotelmatobacter sp.]|jgi:AcrR family transcriptional regulator